jgi:hypothetical protein
LQVEQIPPGGGIASDDNGDSRRRPAFRVLLLEITFAGADQKPHDSAGIPGGGNMKGREPCPGFGIVDIDGAVAEKPPYPFDIADIDGGKECGVRVFAAAGRRP